MNFHCFFDGFVARYGCEIRNGVQWETGYTVAQSKRRSAMNIREFEANRARFSADELMKYDGKWVAFSLDGRKIIAAHEDLLTLDRLLREAGTDPQQTALERIDFDDYPHLPVETY